MIDLGLIPITTRHSVVEARGKIRNVCESLTGDSISATRLGTAVSELTRALLARDAKARIKVGLSRDEGPAELVLTVLGQAPIEVPDSVRAFFEDINMSPGEAGLVATRLFYPLPSIRYVDVQAIAALRRIVQQQSRDELMEELRGKNRELQESFETLKRTTSAKERMESELNIGCDIQMGMLPVDFDAYAHRHEFRLFATLHPAREVGGDFYDFFLIDEDRLCVCVGDVSGKGVPAALFMAVTKTLIKSRATTDFSPASILTHVNDELGHNNESCMFVTVWLGILEIKTGRLRFTNAGHNPPFVKRSSGSLERIAQLHGPVVAAMEGMTYGEDELELAPEDLLLLYTDGVTEAMNEAGALYGEEPLMRSLSGESYSVQGAVSSAIDGVWAFQGAALQADDITVMALTFHGEPRGTALKQLELRILNRLEEISGLIESFDAFAEANGLEDKVRRSMSLVFDELLNNIISYAYGNEGEHWIGVQVELDGGRLSVTVEDEGHPFNPFARSTPDTTLSIEEREIGGLGIHLVRNMMDEVSYVRRTGRNVVNVVKYLVKDETHTNKEDLH